MRHLTEDHGGLEGKKIVSTEREANRKRFLNTENTLRGRKSFQDLFPFYRMNMILNSKSVSGDSVR